MLILGIILLLGGLASIIYGFTQNNSISEQWNSILSSGNANPGTIFIIVGIVAAILGLVFIIIGAQPKPVVKVGANPTPYPIHNPNQGNWMCPNCSQINSNLYTICSCGTPRQQIQRVAVPPYAKWICPHCRQSVNVNNVYCTNCGAKKPDIKNSVSINNPVQMKNGDFPQPK